MSKELTERLRGAVQQLRRTPMPIADVAPMLNQAADTIEGLRQELAEARKLFAECIDPLEFANMEISPPYHWEDLANRVAKMAQG